MPDAYLYVLEAGFAATVTGVFQVWTRLKSRGVAEEIPSYGTERTAVIPPVERTYSGPR